MNAKTCIAAAALLLTTATPTIASESPGTVVDCNQVIPLSFRQVAHLTSDLDFESVRRARAAARVEIRRACRRGHVDQVLVIGERHADPQRDARQVALSRSHR